ncbi:MAG: hypothetical protein PHP03_00750 [Candidatus Pacebacteria bacterium]|nr:hypothetical protein [Candidatus Paceibacterota bacterium]
MDNPNQQNWPNPNNLNNPNPNAGNERPMPPPPPPPEITLRTMQSDIDTTKKSGGEGPTAQPFSPSVISAQQIAKSEPQDSKIELSAFSKEDTGGLPPSSPIISEQPVKSGGSKAVLWIVLAVILAIGVGVVGYFFVFPKFFPTVAVNLPLETPPVTPPVTTPPVIPPEIPPVATTTPPEAPPVLAPHVSLFKTPADSQMPVNLTELTAAAIKTGLSSQNGMEATSTIKEIAISDTNGQVDFIQYMPLLISSFSTTTLSSYFESDFTNFVFYDKNGAWYGLVAKLKTDANLEQAKTLMAKIEKATDLKNLFILDPGTKSTAGFKAGTAGFRYLSYSKTGASLNYGWTTDNLFVISTSYNGLKSAMTKLGQPL